MFNAKSLAAVLAAASLVAAAPQYGYADQSASPSNTGISAPPASSSSGSPDSCPSSGSSGSYPYTNGASPAYPSSTTSGLPSSGTDYPSSGTDYPSSSYAGTPTSGYPSSGTDYPSACSPGTSTSGDSPSKVAPVDPNVVTHRVTAGFNGLNFEPNNVVAQVGEIVEFKFLPRNHSVAQSSFAKPCQPLTDDSGAQTGFFAGFDFVTASGLAEDVFQIQITDASKPIWFYCPQADHCQKGMSGVINQAFDSGNTLAKYMAAATTTDTVIPSTIQGGQEFINPNPNAGFP